MCCPTPQRPFIQRGDNLDRFEYVMVLVSIIIGLGLTHLLQGIGGIIDRRSGHGQPIRMSLAHLPVVVDGELPVAGVPFLRATDVLVVGPVAVPGPLLGIPLPAHRDPGAQDLGRCDGHQ